MAEQDDPRDDAAPTDQDRVAILARRQRFIAVALSGLATAACTSKPQACLEPEIRTSHDDGNEAPPQPCLSAPQPDPDPPPEPPPQVCLKIAQPQPEPEAETGETGQTEAPPEPKPQPQPCLSKPRPCLRKAAPGPCLKVMPDE